MSVRTNCVVTQIRQGRVVVAGRVLSGVALSVKLLRRVASVAVQAPDFVESTSRFVSLIHGFIARMLASHDLFAHMGHDAEVLRFLRYHIAEFASNMITGSVGSQTIWVVNQQLEDECRNGRHWHLQVHEFRVGVALLHGVGLGRTEQVADAILLLRLDIYALLPGQMVRVVTHILQNGFNK